MSCLGAPLGWLFSLQVPLDYDLRAYLKYMFLPSDKSDDKSKPKLEMFVQGKKVRPSSAHAV